MKTSAILAVACIACAFTTLNTPTVLAHEGHDHGAKKTASIPETADGIMTEIHRHHALITTAVTGKNLKGVHDPIEAIPALAKALPDKVAAEKKARVQGSVNNLTKITDTLHHAADASDQGKAEAYLKKLDGVLSALSQQIK